MSGASPRGRHRVNPLSPSSLSYLFGSFHVCLPRAGTVHRALTGQTKLAEGGGDFPNPCPRRGWWHCGAEVRSKDGEGVYKQPPMLGFALIVSLVMAARRWVVPIFRQPPPCWSNFVFFDGAHNGSAWRVGLWGLSAGG